LRPDIFILSLSFPPAISPEITFLFRKYDALMTR